MEFLSSESKSISIDILEDILSAIERVEERTKDIKTIDDFLCSSSGMVLLDATCMLLIAIGESLKNLDKTTEGKLLPTYPSIPWKNVKGSVTLSPTIILILMSLKSYGYFKTK